MRTPVFEPQGSAGTRNPTLSSPLSPENEVLNFKQREGENLKDAWYRICNAQNRSTKKQSTLVLLCNFYVGANPWYRYILDTIIGGNFLGSHTFDSYNAMIDLLGPPPLLVKWNYFNFGTCDAKA